MLPLYHPACAPRPVSVLGFELLSSACPCSILASDPRVLRQALVERYSSLSAEAARREQRALWRIERHRLANARLRFLSEDQKHLQVSPR